MPPYAIQNKGNLEALCKKYPDSEQAHAIWDAIVNGKSHIRVGARAGTGKTFTNIKGAGLIGKAQSVIVLSFNKPIQVEAERKIREEFGRDTQVVAKTFNGAGFGACLNQWPFLRELMASDKAINPDRTWQMLPEGMPASQRSTICKLVALLKNTLVAPTRDNLLDLCSNYDIDLVEGASDSYVDETLALVPEILERSKTPTPESGIDFNDQVWLPVVWQLPVRTYDLVQVDEAQDLNNCRIRLAIMLAGKRGRVMFTGDEHQAIYGFSGSNVTSMDDMQSMLGDVQTFPLNISRRCPKTVTHIAQQYVPDFSCLPNAPDGHVCFGTKFLINDPVLGFRWENYPDEEVTMHNNVEVNDELPVHECNEGCTTYKVSGKCQDAKAKVGDMVLCRLNAPLVQMAYAYIRDNIPVKIQGRDVGKGLADLIKKLVAANSSVDQLKKAIQVYVEKERAKLIKAYGEGTSRLDNALQTLNDKVDCIEALCEGLTSTQEVLSRISVLFTDVEKGNTSGFVLLSSIHKAKGLEAYTVRIIEPSKLGVLGRLPWEKEQEQNLIYVAYTRSLHTLHVH